jgi:hypothetical protein
MKCGTKGVSKICLLASFLFLSIPVKSDDILQQYLITYGSDEVDKVFFCPDDGKIIQDIIIALIASAQKLMELFIC